MPDELVHYSAADAVATVVLDSPHNRNALSRQLVSELSEALDRAEADPGVRVVVIRQEGPVFCSGADLSEAAGGSMEEGARGLIALLRRITTLDKPVVARVSGAVRAGGIGIVGACDIVVAAHDATFALTEVRLGLAPAVISLVLLPRMSSRSAAMTFLSGSLFTGTEAADNGLVTRAVMEEDLDTEIAGLCASLAKGHPQGLRETKKLLNKELIEHIDTGADETAALSARLFASDGAREAMLAFLDRRKPR
ncbi:enoyl-CoA hydratase family protein [Actinocorallia populi]|uniref:enoyl-CoA hydratase family protein n=1 Tax=Actinocorallia populi TaxID=2079200 RepID=UPI000D08A7F7|nr:enoyl-CoA hydratase family protein [Actinocorallia populi]